LAYRISLEPTGLSRLKRRTRAGALDALFDRIRILCNHAMRRAI
jgi:hypothetical protein